MEIIGFVISSRGFQPCPEVKSPLTFHRHTKSNLTSPITFSIKLSINTFHSSPHITQSIAELAELFIIDTNSVIAYENIELLILNSNINIYFGPVRMFQNIIQRLFDT